VPGWGHPLPNPRGFAHAHPENTILFRFSFSVQDFSGEGTIRPLTVTPGYFSLKAFREAKPPEKASLKKGAERHKYYFVLATIVPA